MRDVTPEVVTGPTGKTWLCCPWSEIHTALRNDFNPGYLKLQGDLLIGVLVRFIYNREVDALRSLLSRGILAQKRIWSIVIC